MSVRGYAYQSVCPRHPFLPFPRKEGKLNPIHPIPAGPAKLAPSDPSSTRNEIKDFITSGSQTGFATFVCARRSALINKRGELG